ncbi:GNAT family N-acetyltransferase [Demequina sp. TTPB684]|uniref:GNAT family N-acetyltransferase n=1 Tax=unclassified Demequina TaxID=2620311 RepID=UPI001CF23D81|nr:MULTISPECIES: GNAT family N-acetyltransferase [unclassified Demequina]MCB2413134.1 GNAT family N-acetyltransferase [Demequina sp. TTPB684]UPU87506.1 GNAT family N-acetyltransferase [Demequina sp. TMPB413]
MRELSPGWATDLAVLEHSGSVIDDRGDHLVVRSPQNPDFHWGNSVFVTDTTAVNDADRWVTTFRTAFPDAGWVAIGLNRMPDDADAWPAHRLEVELDEVLSTATLPYEAPLPPGYAVRRFDRDDWELSVARSIAENQRTGEQEAQGFERFVRAEAETRRDLSAREVGAWFGAFADDALVAELGIVRCGAVARYQAVGTDEEHRGRGLASHLLGVAARWAGDHGCDQWVIVTEATNPAGRVYRRAGFEPDSGIVTAYRTPGGPS